LRLGHTFGSWPLSRGSHSFSQRQPLSLTTGPDPVPTSGARCSISSNYRRDEFLTHYYKRSNVETTFHMIKSKFGTRIRSKTPVAQVNELLFKILCHNLCCLVDAPRVGRRGGALENFLRATLDAEALIKPPHGA
jgi:hypothetical protein